MGRSASVCGGPDFYGYSSMRGNKNMRMPLRRKLSLYSMFIKCLEIDKIEEEMVPGERYGEILFQKVAEGYLVPFLHANFTRNALKKYFLLQIVKNPKIPKNPKNIPYIFPI